jgi:GTP cyclohydrolase II
VVSDPRAAARAIDALRRGWPIAVEGTAMLAVETADPDRLAAFDPAATAGVLISAGRAATLKLVNQLAAADPEHPVLVERAPWLDLAGAVALADPQFDLAMPLKGPFRTLAPPPGAAARGSLTTRTRS